MVSTNSAKTSLQKSDEVPTFFAGSTWFIRPLNKDDEPSVCSILSASGYKRAEVVVLFGVFDENHRLLDLYKDPDNAYHNAKNSGVTIMWMH
jgi:hypothetical protein